MKKNYSSSYHKSRKSRKGLWIVLIIILLLVIGAGGGLYIHKKHQDDSEAKTTSTSKSAQNNYQTKDTSHQSQPSNDGSNGGAVDNKGTTPPPTTGTTTPPTTTSTTSPSGILTVSGLGSNDLIQTGYVLHGTVTDKTITQVQFRIVDDSVGVVAEGQLAVVNGNYSGTLSFTPRSATGQVDVFNFDSSSSETNNVAIPVRFK